MGAAGGLAARGAAVAESAAAGAASGAGTRAERLAAGKRGRSSRRGPAPNRTLVVALAVLFGTGFLRNLIADNRFPSRRWWIGTTTVAVFLAIGTDLAPRQARYWHYLIIVGAVYANSVPVIDALQTSESASDGGGASQGGAQTVPVAAGTNSALEPVFLRKQGGSVRPTGGAGAQTAAFVQRHRTPKKKAKRPIHSISV